MKVEGKTFILEPGDKFTGCGYTFEVRENEVEPTPTPPSDETKKDGRLDLWDLLGRFNSVLTSKSYNAVNVSMDVYDYLSWAYGYTRNLYDSDPSTNKEAWMFNPSTYPLLYDYRGKDTSDDGTAYNALQAWLMASILAELVPDSGKDTNTQTELFKLAYEIGGGRSYPLYNDKAFKADPYAMREAASVMYAFCRGDNNIARLIGVYRSELGGHEIPASSWDGLGFKDTELTDGEGLRGYRVDNIGYCVNTRLFLPDAPGPRVKGTTVCDLHFPWEQGQQRGLFDPQDGNYLTDVSINEYFVNHYDMMSQTPLSVWNSYSREKQNRLVNVSAVPPCTREYMFGAPKKVRFDGIFNKSYDGRITADYYCFSQTGDDTGLSLDGPFSDLAGIRNGNDGTLSDITDILDRFRFPTQSPNYGRCRPGCKVSRKPEEKNPVHGAAENELYNVDLTTMVADDAAHRERLSVQDGFAADKPRSYVSGHSSQIWGLALMLTQTNNEGNCEQWIRKAFEYSVNRSVGRFHWNSDCIYGRLFGAMALPIINAMSGMENGLNAIRYFVLNPTPQPAPTGNWDATVIVKNETGRQIQSTGEVRLYVAGHEGVNVYTPNAVQVGTAITIPNGGECAYDTQCVGNGFTLDDSYDGKALEDGRIYDQRHYSNGDWTPAAKVLIDTADSRCSSVLRKSGATYVLKIVNA